MLWVGATREGHLARTYDIKTRNEERTSQIRHETQDGCWTITFELEAQPTWRFAAKYGILYSPTISKVDGSEMRGRHYDATIEDDMVSSYQYALNVKKTQEEVAVATQWHKKMVDPSYGAWKEFAAHTEKDIRNACRIPIRNPMRQGIIVSIDTGEGGDEMHKQLIHVILFNTKTETIDFKEYVSAKDETDAVMIAAQTYGSYDSNVHEVITKDVACYTKKD